MATRFRNPYASDPVMAEKVRVVRRYQRQAARKYGIPMVESRTAAEAWANFLRTMRKTNPEFARQFAESTAMSKEEPRIERTAADMPVTYQMLDRVRQELKSDIASLEIKMDSGFSKMQSTMDAMNAKMQSSLDAMNAQLQSSMEAMNAKLHRMHFLLEEQAVRNGIVLDGIAANFARQDRIEGRINEVEKTIADFKR